MANYELNYTGKEVDALLEKIDTAFGETTVMGDTLTWDGNTEGLDSALDMLYRVSDVTPSLEVCQSGGIVKTFDATTGNYTFDFTAENVIDAASVGTGTNCIVIQIEGSPIFIATADGASVTMDGMTAIFEKAGIYFPKLEGSYVTSITINGYTGFETTEIETIDPKYISGEAHSFIVNADGDYTEGSFTMDKSLVEIMEAYEKGLMCFIKYKNRSMPLKEALVANGYGEVIFEDVNVINSLITSAIACLSIEISNLNETKTEEFVFRVKKIKIESSDYLYYSQ